MSRRLFKSAHSAGMPERRGTNRFPVQERIRYKTLHSKALEHIGTGTTLNMSSGGILFTTENPLPAGRLVELSVSWPARLGGHCALNFVVIGRVVRSDDDCAAIRIQKYEFKTRGVAS
jgi:hypothetical protein